MDNPTHQENRELLTILLGAAGGRWQQRILGLIGILLASFLAGFLAALGPFGHSIFLLREPVPEQYSSLLGWTFAAIVATGVLLLWGLAVHNDNLQGAQGLLKQLRLTDTRLSDIDLADDLKTVQEQLAGINRALKTPKDGD